MLRGQDGKVRGHQAVRQGFVDEKEGKDKESVSTISSGFLTSRTPPKVDYPVLGAKSLGKKIKMEARAVTKPWLSRR